MLCVYLHWEVPCQIDIRFVLVHPDFCHSKSIASSVKGDVTVVGLFCSGNVGHSGTGQNFHAAPTKPNLGFENIHTPIKLQFWNNFKRKKAQIHFKWRFCGLSVGRLSYECSTLVEGCGWHTNPDSQLYIFASIHVHPSIQKAQLPKVFAVYHKRAAYHCGRPKKYRFYIHFRDHIFNDVFSLIYWLINEKNDEGQYWWIIINNWK